MKVVVCTKPIPDPDEPAQFDPVTHRLRRDGKLVLDKADAAGISVGLALVEAAGGGEVVLASMGPEGSMAALLQGLALGAARAVLVTDDELAGADALATARVLAAVIAREAPVDVVITAAVSTDGYSGVLGAMLAELLGWPAVTFARRVTLDDAGLLAERETDAGWDEVASTLPCVVSVLAMAATPRYPSYKAIVGARSKPVEVFALADLGLDRPVAGQEVVAVTPVAPRSVGEVVDDEGAGHQRIVDFLAAVRVV